MLSRNRNQLGSRGQTPYPRAIPADPSPPIPWKELADASNEEAFCSAWLSYQCSRIAGVTAGLITIRRPGMIAPAVSVSWPIKDTERVGALAKIAERAALERRIIQAGPDPECLVASPLDHLVAIPLGSDGQIIAVVAVSLATSRSAVANVEHVTEQLHWGAGWLEALPWARRSKETSADLTRVVACLDHIAVVGDQRRLSGMMMAVVNDLATRFRCDRVAVGLKQRSGSVRLSAISHSATFRGESRLADAIESAMEEAIDQRVSIVYPSGQGAERAVNSAHRDLAKVIRVPGAALMSVAIADGHGNPIGALTFERHVNAAAEIEIFFDRETLHLAETIAALLGPIVGVQKRANRLIAGRVVNSIAEVFTSLFGPRRLALKLAACCATALIFFLAFAKVEYRVTAKAVLQAEVQRAAVAPFEGFIRAAAVRAGDAVRTGDLMVELDDRELLLDRSKWRAERDKLVEKQHDALANHERTSLVVVEAQIRQVESQLTLAEDKLARARIVAPFNGMVVSGDLSQMLGAPVEKGKVLFEIAPLDAYRLIINVDESEISHIASGQQGNVTLSGMPSTPVSFVLRKITPVTVAEDNGNSFRVEAQLIEHGRELRPGMEGVAKIDTGQRSALWIWTHSLVEWVWLTAWKYLP